MATSSYHLFHPHLNLKFQAEPALEIFCDFNLGWETNGKTLQSFAIYLTSEVFFYHFKHICIVAELPFRFFKPVHLYFRLFACINATPTLRISAKFDTGYIYENLSRRLLEMGQKYRALYMKS